MRRQGAILMLGDAFALLLVTVLGFASHGEAGAVMRMPSTLLPLALGWVAGAVPLGLYEVPHWRDWRSLGRVLWAVVLAAPLAAWLRALWLHTAVLPVFVAVLGAFTALFMLLWRAAFVYFLRRSHES